MGQLCKGACCCPLQRDLSWARWELDPLHLALSPFTLHPTKAKTNQGHSEMMQPSSFSALRSTPIPPSGLSRPGCHGTAWQGQAHSTSLPPGLLTTTGTVCWLPTNAERFYLEGPGQASWALELWEDPYPSL